MQIKKYGVMLNMSQNAVMKIERLKDFANIVNKMGYSSLHIYIRDNFEIEGYPYFGYMRGKYSIAELIELREFCDFIGIDIVVHVETLANLGGYDWECFAKIVDGGVLHYENNETYDFLNCMFSSLAKAFKGKTIHLGKYNENLFGVGKHRVEEKKSRREVINEHLRKVKEIATLHGLNPIVWGDSSITEQIDVANDGDFLGAENSVKWCFVDAVTATGFASGNDETVHKIEKLKQKEVDVENFVVVLNKPNGGDFSFYGWLPSLFVVKNGKNQIEKFNEIVGLDIDALMKFDRMNFVGGNQLNSKPISKYMLYNDPFNGFFDSTVKDGINQEYQELAKEFNIAEHTVISKLNAFCKTLCNVLSIKYDLGVRTRKVYMARDEKELSDLIDDYFKVERLVYQLIDDFMSFWDSENKPQGREIQELRLGGIYMRLKSCRQRLVLLFNGEISEIPELERDVLDLYGKTNEKSKEPSSIDEWGMSVTGNII